VSTPPLALEERRQAVPVSSEERRQAVPVSSEERRQAAAFLITGLSAGASAGAEASAKAVTPTVASARFFEGASDDAVATLLRHRFADHCAAVVSAALQPDDSGSRHQVLVRLAQAYVLTREERHAEACLSAIEAWLASPAGDEEARSAAGFRVISWSWSLALLRHADALTPIRLGVIADALRRQAAGLVGQGPSTPATDITVNAPVGTCSAVVNFTVSGSDNCGAPTIVSSPASGSVFPVGTTTVTATATDAAGNTKSCTFNVTVKDVTPPVITLNGQTITLWPPNHQYETIQVSDLVASASDLCDSSVNLSSVVIAMVTSDEPENSPGDGNTLNDIVIAADCKSVQLRSERKGNGDGRVYTITFKVTDSSGNSSTVTAQVTVPKSQNGSPAVDSGVQYTVLGSCP